MSAEKKGELVQCSTSAQIDALAEEKLKDANTCLLLGCGVGALGAASTLVAGAVVCPLCVVVSPALIGIGLVQRLRAKTPNT
jgi:hypothetical protein